MPIYKARRKHMVESQLLPNGVTNHLLVRALKTLPRELFVNEWQKSLSYCDADLWLDSNRVMLAPLTLSLMIQSLSLLGGEKALVIGCGTGYSVAILNYFCDEVVGLETTHNFVKKANKLLSEQEATNASVKLGKLHKGLQEESPFDAILIEGAVKMVPKKLISQLREGGRLVAILQQQPDFGKATLISRNNSSYSQKELFETTLPPLKEFCSPATFSL